MARGGMGPDELAEILGAMGMSMQMRPVGADGAPGAFQRAAQTTLHPGAKLFSLRGEMQNGDTIEALLVLSPHSKQV